MTKEIIEARLDELKVTKGKLALAAYHTGLPVDLDWITHRIGVLEEMFEGLGKES